MNSKTIILVKNLLFLKLLFLNFVAANAQDNFQLAPPLLRYPSVFFTQEAKIEIAFAEPNTQIRYTLNGQDPADNAPLYTHPLRVTKGFTTIKARVFSKNYLPSDIAEATFIKEGLPIKSVESTIPNQKYKGSGATTLIDNKGGVNHASDNTWLGFQTDTVEIILNLNKKEKVKKVLINLLRDYGSWIFLPEKVEVYAFNSKNNRFQLIESQIFKQEKNIAGSACTPLVFAPKNAVKTDKLKVQLYLVKQIPDWHAGKGNKSWIFIDEVKIY